MNRVSFYEDKKTGDFRFKDFRIFNENIDSPYDTKSFYGKLKQKDRYPICTRIDESNNFLVGHIESIKRIDGYWIAEGTTHPNYTFLFQECPVTLGCIIKNDFKFIGIDFFITETQYDRLLIESFDYIKYFIENACPVCSIDSPRISLNLLIKYFENKDK